jgi:hypothetical protein
MARRGRNSADEALAFALAAGQTLRQAAKTAKVSERTAARRWAEAAFRRRVTELQAEMLSQAMGQLADGMTEAVATMRNLLKAKKDGVKLQAAKALLDLAMRMRLTVDHEQRLQALEAMLPEGNPR